MPKKAQDEIRGDDVPLVLGVAGLPRDAATDPSEDDVIADPEKGYHTGLVRQPAEPVVDRATGAVHFESISDEPSKFGTDLKTMKEAHNEAEAGGLEGSVLHQSVTPYTDATGPEAIARRQAAREATGTVRPTRGSATGTVTTPQSEISGSSREISGADADKGRTS
jgi:hypothetical protein